VLVQQLQGDAFDVVLSGIIAQPDRPVATACPDMDFYWDAIYTGRGNLDLRPVQYTDRQTLIAFLVDHPGMSLVSTAGGPSEDAVNAIVAEVRQAGGSISSRTASAAQLSSIIAQQTYDFAIGDGIALSAAVMTPTFKGLNLDINVYTGPRYYLAPFTGLDP